MLKHFAVLCTHLFVAVAVAQQSQAPSLTIYNQNFALVRELVPLS